MRANLVAGFQDADYFFCDKIIGIAGHGGTFQNVPTEFLLLIGVALITNTVGGSCISEGICEDIPDYELKDEVYCEDIDDDTFELQLYDDAESKKEEDQDEEDDDYENIEVDTSEDA
ncbi:MAG: hypothetical protein EZS28_035718 [Streblomastix strix]|uniref:Uncharacterized protein n=1 Tax=Streblomastix strix TaxID=222440 RepID=A0A5J4UEV4_9EUKA|nr:MAG: hypothetical protein EZS28_035718 [Streblomastix strix]